jgi:hypothetical protein
MKRVDAFRMGRTIQLRVFLGPTVTLSAKEASELADQLIDASDAVVSDIVREQNNQRVILTKQLRNSVALFRARRISEKGESQ